MEEVEVVARLVAGIAAFVRGSLGAASEEREGIVGQRGRSDDGAPATVLVAGIEQQGALAVNDEVTHPSDMGGQCGAGQGGCFDQYVRESVVVGGQHDKIAGEIERDEVEAVDALQPRDEEAVERQLVRFADEQEVKAISGAGPTEDIEKEWQAFLGLEMREGTEG